MGAGGYPPEPMSPILLLIAAASAQDAVSLSTVRVAQVGEAPPSITVNAAVGGRVDLSLGCGPKTYHLASAIAPAGAYPLLLAGLPQGHHDCRGKLALAADDGTTGEMPVGFSVDVLPLLTLHADRDDIDLVNRRVQVSGSRPLVRIDVEARGDAGTIVGSGTYTAPGPAPKLGLEWSAGAETLRLHVVGTDANGFRAALDLSPWSYAIPHEDVVFASDQATIGEAEGPKLERAYGEIQKVLARFGDVAEVKLFVAGYTDTVGDGGHNATLSDARARAIAAWFRQRGFSGEIRYQGFGEGALAVATADSVDEPKNRRAVYVIAADVPARSGDLPRSDWKPLR